jgi:hypothetical protein
MVTTRKKKTIFVEPSKRRALCKAMGVSKPTFYNAVNGVSNSELAAKIRKAAVENYGGVPVIKEIVIAG